MNDTLKLGLILLIITSISAVVLAVSNNVTSVAIEEQAKILNDTARREVFEDAKEFEEIESEVLDSIKENKNEVKEIYKAFDSDGNVIGYTISLDTKAYHGNVELLVGITTDKKVAGIKVLNHSETPGLGAKAAESDFQNRFVDKSAEGGLTVVKEETTSDDEIQAISSATITTKGVVNGVNSAIEIYNEVLAK